MKRRKVFQTFALYVVGAWVVIQVAQAAFEAWDIPMQVLRYLWIGLTLVSPLALVFAWRYDITSDGIVRTAPVQSEEPADLSLKTSDFMLLGAFAFVLVMVTFSLLRQAGTDEDMWQSIQASDRPGIAVLPFVDLSADSDLAYFGNGVAEALLIELGHITDLDVIARTSSFHFQGTETSLAEIAAALAVDYLVEGSVNREEETVHVVAKLIDAASGKQLWSGIFQGASNRAFSAQQDIAVSVAGYLEMSIGNPRQHGGTTNFAAYEAYLRAYDEDDDAVALLLLDEALAHDPEFASAMVAKAWVYWGLMWANREDRQEAWEMAEPLLRSALDISDELGEAYALLGGYQLTQQDYESAEVSLQRALEINPSNDFALGRFSQLYMRTGRPVEGIQLAERGVRVDPLNAEGHYLLANRKFSADDIDGAIKSFERAIQLSPNRKGIWFNYAFRVGHIKGGLFRFQLMERMQYEVLKPDQPLTRSSKHIRSLGIWFEFIGDHVRARELLALAQGIADNSWIHLDLAGIALAERDFDTAWSETWLALEGDPKNSMSASWAGTIALVNGTGQEKVLAHYRRFWPGLFGDSTDIELIRPNVEGIDPDLALTAALLLREEGDEVSAATILNTLSTIAGPESLIPVTLLAVSGDIEGALDALEAAVSAGAKILPGSLLLEHLGNEPRFKELLRPEEEEKARIRAEVNAMIERGGIILPNAENLGARDSG